MKELLSLYLQSGLFGSVMIVIILLLRLCMKQVPRKYLCVLWLFAALRLLLPFHLESHLSLQPRYDSFEIVGSVTEPLEPPHELPQWTPTEPDTAVPNPPESVQDISVSLNSIQVISAIWLGVGGLLLLYTLISYGYLRFKVRDAVKYGSGIMESDRAQGAFLLGYFKPKIYIPVGLSKLDREFIIAHEQAHISRGDNWWKLVGFLCVCVHWYNPLVWWSYGLLCQDIEVACDENVVRNMDLEQRKAYSTALLNRGKRLSRFMACPVAFGEVSLKQRIKKVLSYRRPTLLASVIAVVLVIVVAVCFLTTPVTDEQEKPDETLSTTAATEPVVNHVYDDGVVTIEASCGKPGVRSYTCTVCGEVKTEPIPALSHEYDKGVEVIEPNCAEPGVLTYICKNCGDIKSEEIDALEHAFGESTITKEATCKDEGEISVICTICGFREIVEKIPKTDEHNYQIKVVRKPSCVDRGKGENVCTVCGYSVACDFDLTDHTYGSPVVTKEATCAQNGEETYTCGVCGFIYTNERPKKDHVWDDGACSTAAICTVCAYESEKSRGHDYVLDSEKKASQNFAGRRVYRCSRCDNIKTNYFGQNGAYDFEAIKAAGWKRAKELGIGVAPAGYEVHTGHKVEYQNYYFMVELSGGQAALEQGAIQNVDVLYDYLIKHGIDLSDCYVVITVSYTTNGALGTGMFFITVSA